MNVRTIVAVVNYNSADLTVECVASFPKSEDLVFSIVDNASPGGGQIERLKTLAADDSRVRLHRSPQNLGFGGAVNLALNLVPPDPGDRVWVLNPDTRLMPGCHEALVDALAREPEAILSPVIRYASPPDQVWFGGGELDVVRGATRHLTSAPTGTEPSRNSFLTGAAMFMSAGTWISLGGFREDLFMYWEDTDLCIRSQQNSTPLLVIPAAEITHHVGATTSGDGTKSLLWYRYMSRNRLLVCASTLPRGIDLMVGRGAVESARFVWRAVKEPGNPVPRLIELLRGSFNGLSMLARGRR